MLIPLRIRPGAQQTPRLGTAVAFQKSPRDLIGRKDGRGQPHIDGHIGNRRPGTHIHILDAGAVKFHNLARPGLAGKATKEFQNEVFARDIRLECALDIHAPNRRRYNIIRLARQCHRDLDAAGAHRQHPQAAAGGGMAVRAEQRLAGNAESLPVDMVRDTVAGRGIDNAEFSGAGLQETMIVGVAGVGLDEVMIDIADGNRRFDTGYVHRLEFQIDRRACGVLRQNLID